MRRILSVSGDSINFIAYENYGREDDEIVDIIYRANPHLYGMGPVLSGGVQLNLPVVNLPAVDEVVSRWS